MLSLIIQSQVQLSYKTNMVTTRKKKESNRKILSHLDDFDQDMIIGNAASERKFCGQRRY